MIPVRSSSKSSSVRTSVLLQQLSNSSGDSTGQNHRDLHHCSSGSDSPPNSLLVTDPTECTKGSPSPDSSSTSSANSHTATRTVMRSQIKHKNQLHKLNSAGNTLLYIHEFLSRLWVSWRYFHIISIQKDSVKCTHDWEPQSERREICYICLYMLIDFFTIQKLRYMKLCFSLPC